MDERRLECLFSTAKLICECMAPSPDSNSYGWFLNWCRAANCKWRGANVIATVCKSPHAANVLWVFPCLSIRKTEKTMKEKKEHQNNKMGRRLPLLSVNWRALGSISPSGLRNCNYALLSGDLCLSSGYEGRRCREADQVSLRSSLEINAQGRRGGDKRWKAPRWYVAQQGLHRTIGGGGGGGGECFKWTRRLNKRWK